MSVRLDASTIESLADRLRRAHEGQEPIAPIRDELLPGGIEAAYAVQRQNTEIGLGEGRRIVGRKIGLTSMIVQQQLGVDQPDLGMLFADMCMTDGEEMPAGAVLQPRVEAEVAIVLGRDLDRVDATLVDLIGAIDYVLPAIEIVGSRIAGWDISILDTVADNASSGMFVLGTRPTLPSAVDLRQVTMTLEVDGTMVSEGTGAACLGHPYLAALWLVRRMAAAGEPLHAGEVIMTGALGPMVSFAPGSHAVAHIEGLGEVHTSSEDITP